MSDTTEMTVGEGVTKNTKRGKKGTQATKTANSATKVSKVKTKKSDAAKTTRTRKKTVDLDTFVALQEQIAANQKELLESISDTFQTTLSEQLKRANRRRRWNNFFRDVIIIILMLGFGYSVHLLYNLGYRIEGANIVNTNEIQEAEAPAAEPVKDDDWYLANYSYLLDQIKTDLNADSVSAYYLYSDDYKLSDIKPEYLLNMAYRQVARDQATAASTGIEAQESTVSAKDNTVTVSVDTLKAKFSELFGESAKFYASNFSSGCLNFSYQHANETFEAKNQTCALNQHREIIEEIERIYQEGEVIYLISRAGIYDKDERSFYNFNDLFRPVAKDADQTDFNEYKERLNRYQYQFKKSGEKFYFSKITKLD